MSIIEEAVRKVSQHAPRPAAAARDVRREAPRHEARGEPVDTTQALRFQPVMLDDELLEENNILTRLSDPAALRAYKILRTRVLRRMETQNWHTLAVTGTTTGEGKTLTAINLALALAQDSNTWVFLVDLDLTRPAVATYLGINATRGERGLSDYLTGNATLDNIVYRIEGERLAVVPNFTALPHSSELLTSPRMVELLHALSAESPRRIVIFDMPPVLAADDVLAFSRSVDSHLLVVAEGTTGRDQLRSAKEMLSEMNLLGVVLNRSADRGENPYYYGSERRA
ncbi:MAG: CpsD/CapB family tyrosine-protein kinase [Povalibacter sp.]|jgi:protein-tyrosine kinase